MKLETYESDFPFFFNKKGKNSISITCFYNSMENLDQKITGIRVLDIAEEGAKAIETMVNNMVKEVNKQDTPIIDVRFTDNHCFLLLGENKRAI